MSKIKTRSEFARKFPGPYGWLLKNNTELLDKCLPCKHDFTENGETEILEFCRKNNKRPNKESEDLYERQLAIKLRNYHNYDKHEEFLSKLNKEFPKRKAKISKKECIIDAGGFGSRTEWSKKSSSYYQSALRNGWLDECCNHMKNPTSNKPVKNKDTGEVYESAKLASNFIGFENNVVSAAIRKGFKAGGYRWAYCDENGEVIDE